MYYRTCEKCGAHLDASEVCTCEMDELVSIAEDETVNPNRRMDAIELMLVLMWEGRCIV